MAPMFLLTLIGCFLFTVYGALIEYYRRAWSAIPDFPYRFSRKSIRQIPQTNEDLRPGAGRRNEAANIANCIASLSRQSLPAA